MVVTRFCTFLSQHKQQKKFFLEKLLNTFTCLVILKCIHRLLWGIFKKAEREGEMINQSTKTWELQSWKLKKEKIIIWLEKMFLHFSSMKEKESFFFFLVKMQWKNYVDATSIGLEYCDFSQWIEGKIHLLHSHLLLMEHLGIHS